MAEHCRGHNEVEASVGEWKGGAIRAPKLDTLFEVVLFYTAHSFFDQTRARIDSDHVPLVTNPLRQVTRDDPGAAPDIDHPITRPHA
jgi:hypothetical protein